MIPKTAVGTLLAGTAALGAFKAWVGRQAKGLRRKAVVIDERIEPVVRGILDTVVKRDEDRLEASLKTFPDDASRSRGLELAVAICGYALYDTYEGKPTADEAHLLAVEIAAMERWSGLSADQVKTFIAAVLSGRPLADLFEPTAAVMVTYLVTGSLLSSSAKLREGEWWFNHLDRVEAALESTAP